MSKEKKQLFQLSASRLKTLSSCSWVFYAQEILKLPQDSNPKTQLGSICHLILEVLSNPRHRHHYDKIMTFPESIHNSRAVSILASKLIIKYNIPYEIAIDLDDLVLVALRNDFFFEGAKEVLPPEYEFILDTGKYRIKGLMDMVAIYDDYVLIRDYKTQKNKFSDEELKNNIQAKVYQLAIKKLFNKPAKVEFVLLRHPGTNDNRTNHLQVVECASNEELGGLEFYLENVAEYVEDFGEEKGRLEFAYDKGFPEDNSFSGRIQCGRFPPGHLKKSGEPAWECFAKSSKDYYVLINKDGKILKSSLDKSELSMQDGYKIEKRRYNGCPRWQ